MSLVCYPDPLLRRKAEEISGFDEDLRCLAKEMAEFMHRSNGVGLAAPQVGMSIRLVVVYLGEERGDLVIVNPVVECLGGEVVGEEGCLSVPGVLGKVVRAEKVGVVGVGLGGNEIELEADGLMARVFQHETDHLDGTLFIDKLTPASRIAAEPRLRQMRQGS
jgi:peptide deformylase